MDKKLRILKIAGNVTLYLVIAFVLFMSVILIAASAGSRSRNPNREVDSLFGVGVLTVLTDSMEPTFREGDMITINVFSSDPAERRRQVIELAERNEGREPHEKDIITFVDESLAHPNTHRIYSIVRNERNEITGFRTIGDKYDTVDPIEVNIRNVIGTYRGRLVGIGTFIEFLRSIPGFIVIILLPMLLFLAHRLYILIAVVNKLKKEKAIAGGEFATSEDYEKLLKEVEELRARVGVPEDKEE